MATMSMADRTPHPRIRFGVVAAMVAAVGVGAAAPGAADPKADYPPAPYGKPVRYELSGSAPAAEYISYQTELEQVRTPDVPLPWSVDFTAFPKQPLIISAQSQGAVTCTIQIDGTVVHQATAHGAPARTVCSYH